MDATLTTIDCTTGDVSTRALTTEEIAARQAIAEAFASRDAEAAATQTARAEALAAILDPTNGFSLDLRKAFAVVVGAEPPTA